ncbi:MAG TPA: GyrI-like domain-containing protein [Symbiobacteriaceae bacterium]|nr:GyrI-like domain-containing protein [Symbiobacteriaceae bacterium]
MEASLVTLNEIKLVAMKVVGRRSELSHRVPPAWLELVRRMNEIPDKVDPHLFYGVFPEADHLQGGQNGVFTYWVGTEVTEFGPVPSGMTTLTLPGQTYAMATVRGGAEQIDPIYIGLGGWIGEQGRATNPEGFGFERYDSRRQPVTPPYERFDYDIFKPLQG